MLTRDTYIAILEKRAAEERVVDNQDVAHDEYAANMDDNRTYLKGIFDNAGSVEKNQTKHVEKLFPGKEKKESGQVLLKVARQLFDVAMENAPDGIIKTAEPYYREVAFLSFVSELEKIGGLPAISPDQFVNLKNTASHPGSALHGMGPGAIGNAARGLQHPSRAAGVTPTPLAMKVAAMKGQTLSQVAAKNQVAMNRPAKVWDLSGGGGGMGGAARAAASSLPQGGGTSVHQSPGFFSRMFNR